MANIHQDVFFDKNDEIKLSTFKAEDDKDSRHYLCIEASGVHLFFEDQQHLKKFTDALIQIDWNIYAVRDAGCRRVLFAGVQPS